MQNSSKFSKLSLLIFENKFFAGLKQFTAFKSNIRVDLMEGINIIDGAGRQLYWSSSRSKDNLLQ